MAVAFDNVGPSAAGATIASNTVLSFSHQVLGSQCVLLVGIGVDTSNDTGMTCTCTYNGSSMTSLGVVHSGAITSGFLQVFILEVPAGTANVVATVAGGTPVNLTGGSISLSGANAPVGSAHGNQGTNTGVTATISTAATPGATTSGNMVVGFTTSGTSIASATAPSTSRFIKSQTGTGAAGSVAGATSPATGSAVTMAWTMGNDDFGELVVEILAAPPAGGPIRLPQQLGRRQIRRRKSSQVPQFAVPAPNATVVVQTAAATGTAYQPASGTAYITGTAGAGTGYFKDQFGTPRLAWGDAVWALCGNVGRWSSGAWQSDYDTYLTTRQGQGVNVVYTKPMGTVQSGNIDSNGGTFDSLFPFQGGTPSTGIAGANPSTGLTSAYWARIDYFLNSAEARGITVFLNAIGYNSDFNGGPGPLNGKSNSEFQAYGAALGARYASQPNLVWMVADDYFGSADTLISSFLTGLRGAGDTHNISIENIPESTSRLTVDGAGTHMTWGFSNAQFNFVYSYNVIYFGCELAYTADGTLPVIAGDGYFYQGNSTYSGGTGAFAFDRSIRQDAWHALSSGARGKITGDEAIWQWQTGAQAAAANNWWWKNNAKPIRTAIEGMTDWQKLVPDTTSALVTAGRGTHASAFTSGGGGGQYETAFTDVYVTASMTPGGTLALVYLSHGTTITVNTALLTAGWAATWLDPVTGATSSAGAGPTFNSTAKGNNSQGDPDWALVFQVGGNVTAAAGLAAGTGTAQQPVAAVTAFAGLASAAGTAQLAGTGRVPATAAGTGTAQQVTPAVTASAGLAAGTGTAQPPVAQVTAFAGLAAGTGTAQAPVAQVTAAAGLAAGTGTAQAPVAQVTAAAGLAAGTGTAQQPLIAIVVFPGLATGTGTAQQPVAQVTAFAGLAVGTGTALQPTVSTGGNANAAAGLASATGTAQQPVAAVTAFAGLAAGTGTAQAPAAQATAVTVLAAGTGTAQQPVAAVTAFAGLAAGTGTALQPSVSTSGNTNAAAGLASATGTAQPPVAAVTAIAGLATGTGTAQSPVAQVTAIAGLAAGTSTALQPSVSTSGNANASAGLAAGTGTAQQPLAAIIVFPGFAAGTGAALNAGTGRVPGTPVALGVARAPALSLIANAQAATALATALQPLVSSAAAVVKGGSTGTSVTEAAGTSASVGEAAGTKASVTERAGTAASAGEAAGTAATVTSPGSSTGGVT